MEQEKAIVTATKDGELTAKDVQILVASGIIPNNTPREQIMLFGKVCAQKKLDPFSKQIHLIKRGDKYSMETSIDGKRAIASRTREYAGNDDYVFDNKKTEYEMIEAKKMIPTTATATVYRLIGGQRCPFSATARWQEYVPQGNMAFMWNKMPFLMLGKTAESLALRKAFPEELGGVYEEAEMQQADVVVVPLAESKPDVRTAAEVKALRDLIKQAGKSEEDACKAYKVDSLEMLSEDNYKVISDQLNAYIKQQNKEAKKAGDKIAEHVDEQIQEAVDNQKVVHEGKIVDKSATMSYAERVEADMKRIGKQKKSTDLPKDAPKNTHRIKEEVDAELLDSLNATDITNEEDEKTNSKTPEATRLPYKES